MVRLNMFVTSVLVLSLWIICMMGPHAVPGMAAESAGEVFPASGWQDLPDPLASEDATLGGSITFNLSQEPSSFNNYLDSFSSTRLLFEMMYESLMKPDPVTIDDRPNIASKWSISADKKTFTFWLDSRARWSDGKPVTAHDVKATFDAIMASPRTGPTRLFLTRFETPVVQADDRIAFTAKKVHWRNLSSLGTFAILPKHLLDKTKIDDLHFKFPITSGPYRISERKAGQSVTMSKRQDWWQGKLPRQRNKYNFEGAFVDSYTPQGSSL